MAKKKPGLTGRRKARKAQERTEKTAKLGSGKRFAAVEKSVAKGLKKSSIRPGQTREEAAEGIAAAIGRKKFGKGKFQKLAAKGRK